MNYQSDMGVIDTPNYRLGPYPNIDCVTNIQSASGAALSLVFNEPILLEEGRDFLRVCVNN